MKPHTTIDVDCDLAGSGKTSRIVDNINNKKYNRVIYVTHSISVCKSTRESLEQSLKIASTFTEENRTTKDTCIDMLVDAIESLRYDVIIATHATLNRMFNLQRVVSSLEHYSLVIDESISFYNKTFENFFDYEFAALEMLFEKTEFDTYYKFEVIPERIATLRTQIENLSTSLFKRTIFSTALSAGRDLIMHKRCYQRLTEAQSEPAAAYFLSVVSSDYLSRFNSIEMLSALYNHDPTYKLLTQLNYDINLKNTDKTHTNKNAKIFYILDELYTADIRDNTDLQDKYFNYINSIHSNKDALIITNNSYVKKYTNNAYMKPDSVSGSNKFLDRKIVVSMISRNENTLLSAAEADFGITKKSINFSLSVLNDYQFIMRSALRDKNNIDDVYVYVITKESAQFMKSLFPFSQEITEADVNNISRTTLSNEEKAEKKRRQTYNASFRARHFDKSRKKWRTDTNPQKDSIKKYNKNVKELNENHKLYNIKKRS